MTKDSLTPDFSWEAALFLAHACQLSYRDQAEVVSTLKDQWKFDDALFMEVDDHQGFVCTDSERVLIVFRGTDAFADWATNLEVPPTDQPYGKVHRGFHEAWSALEYDVTSALERFDRERTKQLYVAGHSLGGSMANVAAMELPKTRAIRGLYTYGQPRTGRDEFVSNCNAQFAGVYHRLVNNNDVVAMIPPGYSHAGKLYWFDADGSLKPEGTQTPVASSEEYRRLKDRIKSVKERLKEIERPSREKRQQEMEELRKDMPSVDDHMMDNYIAACEKQAGVVPTVESTVAQVTDTSKPESAGAPTGETAAASSPGKKGRNVGGVIAAILVFLGIAAAIYFYLQNQ